MSAKIIADNKYLKELYSRRFKALDDPDHYKEKISVAKPIPKGDTAAKKSKQINSKLARLAKLLFVIRNLTAKRQVAIFATALKEIPIWAIPHLSSNVQPTLGGRLMLSYIVISLG